MRFIYYYFGLFFLMFTTSSWAQTDSLLLSGQWQLCVNKDIKKDTLKFMHEGSKGKCQDFYDKDDLRVYEYLNYTFLKDDTIIISTGGGAMLSPSYVPDTTVDITVKRDTLINGNITTIKIDSTTMKIPVLMNPPGTYMTVAYSTYSLIKDELKIYQNDKFIRYEILKVTPDELILRFIN